MNSARRRKFRNCAKFHRLRNFANLEISILQQTKPASATPAKQRTKIIRIGKCKPEKHITKTKLKIKELCKTTNKTKINKQILNKIWGGL